MNSKEMSELFNLAIKSAKVSGLKAVSMKEKELRDFDDVSESGVKLVEEYRYQGRKRQYLYLTITEAPIEVESISGRQTGKGYAAFYEKHISATQWEPSDVDVIELVSNLSFMNVLNKSIQFVIEQRLDGWMQSFYGY